ncbi:GMC family oxidoreductase N-terminal domain-containing protein [Streptomyces sp. NPDC059909]|uniref:GMC family oxidoreductase N-terminal domain-containing protein n=1 Tax=Streptomyces sp. NPDC059909 TaxID=3346998 RepID=UPI00364DF129
MPQTAAGGIARRYPRGKVLGGSSSINGMAFIRGHRAGYEEWAAIAPGWGYEDLLPFFKRSEATQGRDPAYRGTDGPMRVAPARNVHPLSYDDVPFHPPSLPGPANGYTIVFSALRPHSRARSGWPTPILRPRR